MPYLTLYFVLLPLAVAAWVGWEQKKLIRHLLGRIDYFNDVMGLFQDRIFILEKRVNIIHPSSSKNIGIEAARGGSWTSAVGDTALETTNDISIPEKELMPAVAIVGKKRSKPFGVKPKKNPRTKVRGSWRKK